MVMPEPWIDYPGIQVNQWLDSLLMDDPKNKEDGSDSKKESLLPGLTNEMSGYFRSFLNGEVKSKNRI